MLRLIKRYKRLSFLIGLVLAALLLFISFKFLLSPAQPVSTYELPYVQNFDDVDLKRWFTNGGVWSIRSGTLVQTVGGEDPAHLHIPLKVPENQPYHISVFLTVKKDTRSIGLSFNAQYPNLISKEQRVYLNQPVQGQFELVAGYMDSTGSFVPQSQVPISANTGSYRLDVYVYESTYLVQLNGQRMIDSRSLYYKNGMVGFYAVGSATFDTLKVSAAESSNPGNMVYTSDFDQNPGGAGWVPISGSWSIDAKQMTQSDASVADAAIGYETSTFQNYVIQSTFTHQQGAGAGILFNMPSPYQLNSAHVVRYSDETDSLIWGNYDVKGAFVRQGFVNVPAPGVRSHKLAVYSGENSYDIYLDDQLVAKNIPLNEKRGSIGLITSHAAAAFSSVEVFPLFGVDTQPTAI